jgi:hypothetical protein
MEDSYDRGADPSCLSTKALRCDLCYPRASDALQLIARDIESRVKSLITLTCAWRTTKLLKRA